MITWSVMLYQGLVTSTKYEDVLLHLPTDVLQCKTWSGQYEWFKDQNCCCYSNWMFEFCILYEKTSNIF